MPPIVTYLCGLLTLPVLFFCWWFALEVWDHWNVPDEQLRPWARWVRARIWRPVLGVADRVDAFFGRPLTRALCRYAERKQREKDERWNAR